MATKVKMIFVASVHRDRTTIWGAPLSEMNHGIFRIHIGVRAQLEQ